MQIEGDIRTREYAQRVGKGKKPAEVKRTITEVRVSSILKLHRPVRTGDQVADNLASQPEVPFLGRLWRGCPRGPRAFPPSPAFRRAVGPDIGLVQRLQETLLTPSGSKSLTLSRDAPCPPPGVVGEITQTPSANCGLTVDARLTRVEQEARRLPVLRGSFSRSQPVHGRRGSFCRYVRDCGTPRQIRTRLGGGWP